MSESSCAASEPFALRVIGENMAPEFKDGHIVIVDPGGTVRSGCFIVADTADGYQLGCLSIRENQHYLFYLCEPDNLVLLPDGMASIVGVISQRSGKRRSEHKRYNP
jgi:DNA polymerase V